MPDCECAQLSELHLQLLPVPDGLPVYMSSHLLQLQWAVQVLHISLPHLHHLNILRQLHQLHLSLPEAMPESVSLWDDSCQWQRVPGLLILLQNLLLHNLLRHLLQWHLPL